MSKDFENLTRTASGRFDSVKRDYTTADVERLRERRGLRHLEQAFGNRPETAIGAPPFVGPDIADLARPFGLIGHRLSDLIVVAIPGDEPSHAFANVGFGDIAGQRPQQLRIGPGSRNVA